MNLAKIQLFIDVQAIFELLLQFQQPAYIHVDNKYFIIFQPMEDSPRHLETALERLNKEFERLDKNFKTVTEQYKTISKFIDRQKAFFRKN